MKTIAQLIVENPDATDAEIVTLHNAQPPEPKAGPIYVTYVSIGTERELLGAGALNVAGGMSTKLKAWIASGVDLSLIDPAMPNPGVLELLQGRLAGSPGVDFTEQATPSLLTLFSTDLSQLNPALSVLPPILTPELAAKLLSLGFDVAPTIAESDVTAERARQAVLALQLVIVAGYNAVIGRLDRERFGLPDPSPDALATEATAITALKTALEGLP